MRFLRLPSFIVTFAAMQYFKRHIDYYKRILTLAMPVVLAQAGQLTTQFADTAMVDASAARIRCRWPQYRSAARSF